MLIVFQNNALQSMFLTVAVSLYKSFYTFGVFFMILTTYSLVGVVLFGNVKVGRNYYFPSLVAM